MNKKILIWTPTVIKGKKMQRLADWINSYGDFDKHKQCLDDECTIGKDMKPNHITEYGRGYHQCISDIYAWIGLDCN